jgi:hypothetical protein
MRFCAAAQHDAALRGARLPCVARFALGGDPAPERKTGLAARFSVSPCEGCA